METTDVLIVGAGPSGLMCALALAKYNVRTMVVERREPGTLYGNADTIQPGTIEMLESFDLRDKFMEHSRPVFAYAAYSADDETGLLVRQPQGPNVVVSDARYPYELGISIERIETILRDAAVGYGTKIEQPWMPTMLVVHPDTAPDSYPIEVTIARSTRHYSPGASPGSSPGGPEIPSEKRTVRAKYVIGCDGAHSWVRDAVGLHMEKAERDEQAVNWGVTTFTPDTDFPDTMVKAVIATPVCGMISWMPRPDGKGRLYVPLSSSFDSRSCTKEVFLEAIQSVLDDAFKPYKMKIAECHSLSAYKVVQSVAQHFQVYNRVFLAGDSAYTHSAKTGQGANAAMKDAYNLSWKLAFVLRGWAKSKLLDTYEDERRAYAKDLIALDQEIAQAIERGGHSTRYRRMWDEKNRFITGVGIVYHSSLTPEIQSSALASRLTPGERLPPAVILRLADWRPWNIHDILVSDCTFKLMLFPGEIRSSQDKVAAFADILQDLLGNRQELVKISAVFLDLKVWSHWTDVAPCIRDPLIIFVDDAGSTPYDGSTMDASPSNAYKVYGIAPEGCGLLLRPDSHVSLVFPISKIGANAVADFLNGL
ncbi:hypothetical protein K488DRAFT_87804 [Vararia minispora EC-137]|uniref:Uncharacterized protein n=1 Tax=Vararia minispora EC-137 TaxID=1314806 RepID=A0ACB8QF57_9AGAM|nr:hypothetical protein K488DRAFT_87804 [Vararia minispora EC-137]